MIRSMTAFSQRQIKGTWGTATWELRSINQRYLEIYIHLPEQLQGLEPIIRECIYLHLTRGKVECNLRLDVNPSVPITFIFNETLTKQLIEAAQWIKKQSKEGGEIDLLAILRWPGVIVTTKQNIDSIRAELLYEFDNILKDFLQVRKTEGSMLDTLIKQRLVCITYEVDKIRKQMPTILVWQRDKLLKIIGALQVQIDSNRVEQELIILANKIDVVEELDRLEVHIKETYQILNKKEAVGRRLDFMMQELNRETNTIASKSIHSSITTSAIELKVLIEQIREQIQNIE